MNLLLDTHVLLWWLDDNPTISKLAHANIAIGKNIVFYSAVTIWEIRIKEALGKLKIPDNFEEVLKKQPFESLDITVEHAHSIRSLPLIHRDPFDRLLIAQAKIEKMTLVTRDTHIKKYGISFIDA
jgi:PIN domain nuclease of toxin-antitoxin system